MDVFCLIEFALLDPVLSNILGKTWQNLGVVVELKKQVHRSEFVGEGNGLGRWERTSNCKYITLLQRGTFLIVKFILNLNWILVELLHLEVLHHEVWRQHGGLKSASPGDGLL